MNFEEAPQPSENSAEVLPEKLPEFEEIINKQEIDRRGEEFAEQMAQHVKEQVKAWIEQAGELVPEALSGGADHEKVNAILVRMGESGAKFFRDTHPISRESAGYFRKNVDDVIVKKWDELFEIAMAQGHETVDSLNATISRVDEWHKAVSEKGDQYYKEWFDNFSKKLNDSTEKFVAEIVQAMKSDEPVGQK